MAKTVCCALPVSTCLFKLPPGAGRLLQSRARIRQRLQLESGPGKTRQGSLVVMHSSGIAHSLSTLPGPGQCVMSMGDIFLVPERALAESQGTHDISQATDGLDMINFHKKLAELKIQSLRLNINNFRTATFRGKQLNSFAWKKMCCWSPLMSRHSMEDSCTQIILQVAAIKNLTRNGHLHKATSEWASLLSTRYLVISVPTQ